MRIISSLSEMQAISKDWDKGQTVGFVPTMGYLHQGHMSLVQASMEQCDLTVVSIFVNPAQFGANEDLGSYPRDLDRDIAMLSRLRVDYVFTPQAEELYPPDYKTWVDVIGISSVLCGASRPGHFKGVATIVLKLVNLVNPTMMFMGEKDFQQVAVLRTMLKDLNHCVEIVPCPIVREPDGLAMSSRNKYLNPQDRKQALCLSQAIDNAKSHYKQGQRDVQAMRLAASQVIENNCGRIDYISFVDSDSLQEVSQADEHTRMILAVFIGKTRLIDNAALKA